MRLLFDLRDWFKEDPEAQLWWLRMKHRWPLLVWALALGAFGVMYLSSTNSNSMRGVVDVVRESVASMETARLRSIHVRIGDEVKAGDIVASLDTTYIDSEMLVSQSQLVMDGLQNERQFESAVVAAERELQRARFEKKTHEVEWAAVEAEIKRLESRLERRLTDEEAIAPWRIRRLTLERELSQHPSRIELLEDQLAAAQMRSEQMKSHFDRPRDISGAALPEQIELSSESKQTTIDFLNVRRDSYFIRASQDGVVSMIEKEPGEVVQAGEPILSLVLTGSQQIVAFVAEKKAHSVRIGTDVTISRTAGPRERVIGCVLAMGPEIQTVPTGLTPGAGLMLRGRRVVLAPREHNVFLPGETVSISPRKFSWLQRLWDRDDEPTALEAQQTIRSQRSSGNT